MLNSKKLIIAASVFALTSYLVSGERAEAVTGNASAQIAIPVTVAETTALDHGTVTASGSVGTVTISAAGVRGVTGGVAELGGSPSQGVFAVTGEANNAFTTTMSAIRAVHFLGDARSGPARVGGSRFPINEDR